MPVFNLGSINADHFYHLSHFPAPGETLAADSYHLGLGGKGANQSVAVARAGGKVTHIGAVGADGAWMVRRLAEFGVDVGPVRTSDVPSGHAIISVVPSGENAIVLFSGANRDISRAEIEGAMQGAQPTDWLILQNETSMQVEAASYARSIGMQVAYSAAPFEPDAVRAVLPFVTLLILNEVEASQLAAELDQKLEETGIPLILVTRGADGADWFDRGKGTWLSVPAFKVTAIDTTGAGDTFAGYVVAGLDAGLSIEEALRRASAAAALQVQKEGTAEAIPSIEQVLAFLG